MNVVGLSRAQVTLLLERAISGDKGWSEPDVADDGLQWFEVHKGSGLKRDDPSIAVFGPTVMAHGQGKSGPVAVVEVAPLSTVQFWLYKLRLMPADKVEDVGQRKNG